MISFVSSATVSIYSRGSSARLQSLLVKAQSELSSGRHADIGLALGARTASGLLVRMEIVAGSALLESNGLLKSRLSAVDGALGSLAGIAQSMQQTLAASNFGSEAVAAIEAQAKSALAQTVFVANAHFGGAYLFLGMGAGGKPLNDIAFDSTDGPGAELRNRFVTRFGAPPGDASTASIPGSDMMSFLDNEYTDLFELTQWSTHWSHATDRSDQVRIADGESIDIQATASSTAIRELVKSLTMLSGLGASSLGADARAAIMSKATQAVSRSVTGLMRLSADVGLTSARVQDASEALQARQNQLQGRLSDLESVDPAEVSLRLSALSTQLQASYQTTAMLAKLSLMNFL